MSVPAHPRFLRRRTGVREHRARRHVRRTLWILLLVAVAWAVAWVAQSPLFSVAIIEVEGVGNANVAAVLEANDVYPGRPLVLIRTGAVEAALKTDPWVKESSVQRRFPDRIEVHVTERVEVAVVPVVDGWRTVADDGRVMAAVAKAPSHLARVTSDVAYDTSDTETVSETMFGVVEFLAGLPQEVLARTTIAAAGPELVASVEDHTVRLGTASNMAAKAAALAAVLADSRLASNAIIDLIAPARPAVSSPAPPPPPSAPPPPAAP